METRRLVIALGTVAALALPAAPVLAAHGGEGGHHGGRDGGHVRVHGGGAVGGAEGHRSGHGTVRVTEHGKRHQVLRQVEGVVSSYDGTTLVLHPRNITAVTVTVAISSSTVITADQGVAPVTLAAGEQVHVKAVVGADGSLTAVRVTVQRPEADAAQTPEAEHPAEATPEPTTTSS